MVRWRDLPWGWKLAALLVALAIVPIAAVTIFNETSARRAFLHEGRTRNLQQAENTAVMITRYLQGVRGDVTLLALSPVTSRVIAAPGDPVALAELRVTMDGLRQTKGIEMLQVLDPGGTVIASTEPSLVGRSLVSAAFFVSAIAGQADVQEPRYEPDDGAVHISLSVPVRDSGGRIVGVAMGRVSLNDLDALVAADTNFGSLEEFGILFDDLGLVISSPAHPERRFRPLAPLQPLVRGRLVAESRFGPDTVRLVDAPADAQAVVERARWRLFDANADPHAAMTLGDESLQTASVPVAGTRWSYAVATPEWKALAAVREQSQRNIAVAIGTALVALLIGGLFARSLARPLSRVQEAAGAIAAGDLSRRTGLSGRDEIGRLAAAFDAMAAALSEKDAELRKHAESLEQRVEERTAELRGLLLAVPDLIFKMSADGRLLDYIAAKDDDLAATPQQFLGRPIAEIMPPDVADATLDRVHRALAGEAIEPYEYRLSIRGNERHFEARISASGRDAVVILVRNVTDRRRNEERTRFLGRAAESLSSSLDYGSTVETLARLSVPFLADLCIVDLIEHRQIRLGAVAATTPEREAMTIALRTKFPLALDAPHPETAAMRTGPRLFRHCTIEMFRPFAQSEEDLALVDAIGLTTVMVLPLVARGQTLGSMMFGRTDPQRQYTEADLALAGELVDRAGIALDNARLYREVQESNRLKDEFLGTVSHELRTPLNAVLGWTTLLRRGATDPAQTARALDAIERNARAQAQLVEDLLDTSRVVSGKLRIDLAPLDVSATITGAVESLGPLARARGLELTGCSEQGLPAVLADATRLQQVIGNLVSNAIKFTPAGGRVDVRARRAGATIEIAVADTGAGIAPEFLPFVFDRFRQGDSTTTRVHGGLGLGLAIARHLVELHGGTIRAESAGEQKGSIFTVVLPATDVRPLEGTPAGSDADTASIAGVRVLAVDDQEDARVLLRAVLESAGAEVELASSAAEARRVMAARRPDVLVADIAMPAEDGYSLVRAVRQEESLRGLPHLPAIALTAHARDDDRLRVVAAGFDRHLTKPLDAAALLNRIAELASGGSRTVG